jgi:hypothetical protein
MRVDFDAAITDFAAKHHGVIARREAIELGGTPRMIAARVRSGRWVERQPLAYVLSGAPDTFEQRLRAAVVSAHLNARASHGAAARLDDIPGFASAAVELTAPHKTRRTERLVNVTRHYSTLMPDHHRKTSNGIPTTTVARTLFDLCAVVHPGRAARAVDNCLTRSWVTVPALWRVLDDLAVQGRNGTCALRLILQERGEGYVAPASDTERAFLRLLRRAGLPLPARELDLGDADQWIGRVEFVYRDERVLIEVDTRKHHTALLDFEHDRARDNSFAAEGWRVLRITHDMISKQPREVERVIRRALRLAA